MPAHVAKTVSNCFTMLRHIRSIRRSVTKPVLQSLVASMALTRLDYGSATHATLSNTWLNRLQSVLGTAALLIHSTRICDHVTLLLRGLHWSRVPERIAYHLAALACFPLSTWHCTTVPLSRDQSICRRQFSKAASISKHYAALVIPRTKQSTIGDRAFPVAASRV